MLCSEEEFLRIDEFGMTIEACWTRVLIFHYERQDLRFEIFTARLYEKI